MGGATNQTITGSTSGNGSAGLGDLLYALNQIYNLLLGVFGLGGSAVQVDILTAATTSAPLYSIGKPVKHAILQNLDATNIITINGLGAGLGKGGTPPPVVAGAGIILNPAPGAGQGGGSMPVGNVDLSAFTFIANGGTPNLAVYYEV